MKVLQLCSKPPLPAIDGGCKAMNTITEGLMESDIKVKVITISTEKHPFKEKELDDNYVLNTSIEHAFVDTKIYLTKAVANLFTKESFNITRFFSEEFEQLVVNRIKENDFDIVLLEGLYVTSYIEAIREVFFGKIIYRAHNIEHEIWERNAVNESNILIKKYLQFLANRLKKYEVKVISEVDGIAAISEKDQTELIRLGCEQPINVFPFGVNVANYCVSPLSSNVNFFYIGSMDWMPNLNGIKWFLENVWDDVVLKNPNACLNIAGKGMPKWMLQWKQKNVTIYGEVADASSFISDNDIMVVPLFSASGMRIKIIEAMAMGRPVIATSVAAEGINYTANKNILIANSKEEYITSITKCLLDRAYVTNIGNEANKMIQTDYDNRLIVNNLVQYFKDLMNS